MVRRCGVGTSRVRAKTECRLLYLCFAAPRRCKSLIRRQGTACSLVGAQQEKLPILVPLEDAHRTAEPIGVPVQVAVSDGGPMSMAAPYTGAAILDADAAGDTYGPVRMSGQTLSPQNAAWVSAKMPQDFSRGRVNRAPHFLDMVARRDGVKRFVNDAMPVREGEFHAPQLCLPVPSRLSPPPQ